MSGEMPVAKPENGSDPEAQSNIHTKETRKETPFSVTIDEEKTDAAFTSKAREEWETTRNQATQRARRAQNFDSLVDTVISLTTGVDRLIKLSYVVLFAHLFLAAIMLYVAISLRNSISEWSHLAEHSQAHLAP